MSETVLVCDIQRFSVHDGPGIRTTVFFKGCPLRCAWCQNPETLRYENELAFSADRCIACGDCAEACPNGAIGFSRGPELDRDRCQSCFGCAQACPSTALEPVARACTARALLDEVTRDRDFYRPEGGVTLSGGEPLSHPRFLAELLPLLRGAGLHVVAETCGHFGWGTAAPLLEGIDLVLFDFKAASPDLHRRLTGKDNRRILQNLERLVAAGIEHRIRIPIVPGLNDDEKELAKMAGTLRGLGEREVTLLPYHRLGESKLGKLHTAQKPLGIPGMKAGDLSARAGAFERAGLRVVPDAAQSGNGE